MENPHLGKYEQILQEMASKPGLADKFLEQSGLMPNTDMELIELVLNAFRPVEPKKVK